ncbi:hypothetical protein PSTT_15561 [Puccinia striiformis]|uniref:Uncharacterized protein n=2 Tax=Puccinia striiformis TaxID=27350 RepID=A0A0L0W469_9BASI|nr:hypothetical protein PSTG_00226 [Puccinia striiformis f. sp. tritici PST-78]POV96598.1 hypothetical protein PSTT_15561 [Puccinia striiformis]
MAQLYLCIKWTRFEKLHIFRPVYPNVHGRHVPCPFMYTLRGYACRARFRITARWSLDKPCMLYNPSNRRIYVPTQEFIAPAGLLVCAKRKKRTLRNLHGAVGKTEETGAGKFSLFWDKKLQM